MGKYKCAVEYEVGKKSYIIPCKDLEEYVQYLIGKQLVRRLMDDNLVLQQTRQIPIDFNTCVTVMDFDIDKPQKIRIEEYLSPTDTPKQSIETEYRLPKTFKDLRRKEE